MSDLRAPAAPADRREGGRHGRPVARPAPALPETPIRPQLMRLAVLPPLAVALSATAAVLVSIRSAGARTGPTLWAVLAGAATVAVAGILIAAVAADRAARSVSDRVDALRRTAARGEADLHALVDALRQGEAPPPRAPRRRPPADADDFDLLAADLARAHDGAVTAVVRAAQLSSQAGSEQKLEVFVNLARRLQSLVHREISILDELENEIEDPDLLKGLFHVDHLATRIRRHAENLAVLGGAVSRRQWSNPVSMTEVLRSAIAEVEQYSRVKLVPPIDGELRGHAVADVIHLLAELIENASVFSAPHTQVLLRAGLVTSGLAVEVEDRGLGMPVGEQNRMNALLADPDQVNVASLLADGRIGLYVVSQLARRHGIHVRLQTNIYGGVQAVLVVPQALLGTAPGPGGTVAGAGAGTGTGTAVHRTQGPTDAGHGAGQARGSVPDAPSASATGVRTGEAGSAYGGIGPGAEVPAVPGSEAGGGAVVASWGEAGPGGGQTRATGRRRHAQRGSAGHGGESGAGQPAESGAGPYGESVAEEHGASCAGPYGENGAGRRGAESGDAGRSGGGLAPLPVRGARQDRPTPAEALPGIGAEDRAAVEAHAGILPTPRSGTMGKPRLPRRRAQEHIVPQLRGGPLPRQDGDTVPGHDPGLMAAFQRGIGLAEAQQHLESEEQPAAHRSPAQPEYGHARAGGPPDSGHLDAAHMGAGPMENAHTNAPHPPDAPPMQSVQPDTTHTAFMAAYQLPAAVSEFTDPPRVQPDPTGPEHMDRTSISQGRPHAPTPDGAPGAGRPDGSAPAG
ncbi:ATP-binding protein [Streptomyces sp. NBC_00557]|uniref:ATP-binding protein n=1 Tax=Streptomyces sp. NBC_00557 TaxID=2975776 RepID=UPI002E80D32D|nr:ATP-binding protein [Streptomyces sp. NBC_00557]WUC33552.1 ATP-binding protein [Streptomyces sp. NBC_00557]